LKVLFFQFQIKVRRVNKVLPPGSANINASEPDLVKINKILNGDGTKDKPVDLTASTPASSEPSPPIPKSVSSAATTSSVTPNRGPSAATVQLKTVETSPNSMIQVCSSVTFFG
jgi:hypothetical protein